MQGDEFVVGRALRPVSDLAGSPPAMDKLLHINSFSIDYRPDGSVAQFYRCAHHSIPGPSQPASQPARLTNHT
jgi:cytochrome c biogenesis protein